MTEQTAGGGYLSSGWRIADWLTTSDHKRVAWLFLFSILFFFIIGGLAATVIRLELFTSAGDLVSADTYNRLFTLHGVIMVWFFLIPSIPTTLGNFLLPLLICARDLAFLSLLHIIWSLFTILIISTLDSHYC